jgi:trehalose/maltose hydrolase-like predicted phosphorylase
MDLMGTLVDGVVSADRKLKGKLQPYSFKTACDDLGAAYDRTVIVEDAVSGVQAGMNGRFGLVLGVAREDNEIALKKNGADIVVSDLGEISFEDVESWFLKGIEQEAWTLSYDEYDPDHEGTREALCAVGNGYLGTRGALEEVKANGVNYPGTYIAGVYNRLESEVAGRTIINEDFVNCPNWLPITFKLADRGWFDPNSTEVLSFSRRLDFRTGVLQRTMLVRDPSGRETFIESWRLASMADPHLVALRYKITPVNYDETITLRSSLDGKIENSGVERYRQLNSQHLKPHMEGVQGDTSYIVLQTNQSGITIAEAAKHLVLVDGKPLEADLEHHPFTGVVHAQFSVEAQRGKAVLVDKLVAVYTSRDHGVEQPLESALATLDNLSGFEDLQEASAAAWADIWDAVDIQIEGDRYSQKLLRLNLFHSLVSASPHNEAIDAGIPARGLHGEAYRGHIFWDELYILPLYNMHFPQVTKSALLYRYHRLEQARAYAREHGYKGAMYPWQSGSDGREETQVVHLNPLSGTWGPDYSSLQRHVGLAIAINIWRHYWITGDKGFLEQFGAEMFLDICRFWSSLAAYDEETGRFDIERVMGPDEYHEGYPGSEAGGLKNNSYTNILVVWAFERAFEILDSLEKRAKQGLLERLEIGPEELERWGQIAKKIHIPLSEHGILEQFEGYFELEELDWAGYREKYGDISRMDRILKAEGKSPDGYKVAKQADALMAFFALPRGEVERILHMTGVAVGDNLLSDNFQYYLGRTSHGSTLSNIVHSYLANRVGKSQLSWELFERALHSDYLDIQGGTTKEGIHTGVLAGSAILALKAFAGLNLDSELIELDPHLPERWRRVRFNLRFRGDRYWVEVAPDAVEIRVESPSKNRIDLKVFGRQVTLENDRMKRIERAGGV